MHPQNLTGPITIFSILREIHEHCQRERIYSLETVHQLFNEGIRHCSMPTAASNPSMAIFADWVARRSHLTKSIAGRWQMLSSDFWRTIQQLEADDARAYSRFWELLDAYCQLEERVVSLFRCNDDGSSPGDGALLRCELIQLVPETGVYLRSHHADSQSTLGERILNLGFFDSPELAKAFAETTNRLPSGGWSS